MFKAKTTGNPLPQYTDTS